MPPRRALYVGIEGYHNFQPLPGCVADAKDLAALLATDHDEDCNFEPHVLASPTGTMRATLQKTIDELFEPFDGDILFYFSGHGARDERGIYLVTSDGRPDAYGVAMDSLFESAQAALAHCTSVTIILDCCYSGGVGNRLYSEIAPETVLAEGTTVLAASRSNQLAGMVNGRSVFTQLLRRALNGGGSSDPRGRVTAASAYSYIENALGSFDQRPVYKSHAIRSTVLRRAEPEVPDCELRYLTKVFESIDTIFPLDATFEQYRLKPGVTPHYNAADQVEMTDPPTPDKKALRDRLKLYHTAGLLKTALLPRGEALGIKLEAIKDLFWACLYEQGVKLTALGQYYWDLVKRRQI